MKSTVVLLGAVLLCSSIFAGVSGQSLGNALLEQAIKAERERDLALMAAEQAAQSKAKRERDLAKATAERAAQVPPPAGSVSSARERELIMSRRQDEQVALGKATQLLLGRYRNATDTAARSELRQEIGEAVAQEFDARQAVREHELKQLIEQVQRLKAMHGRRNKAKATIVRDRVDQLLREADGLGWDGPGAAES